MAKVDQKDRFSPSGAPPPYTTQPGTNNSNTIISFPEVVVNNEVGSSKYKMSQAEQKDGFSPDVAQTQPPYFHSLPVVLVNIENEGPGRDDGRDALMDNFAFSDKQIRRGFIRKVYSIIMVQLLITCGVIAWFMNDETLQFAVERNIWIFFGVTIGVYLTTALCIMCCEGPRRRVPYNYIFLLMFTLSLSALVGVVCTRYRFQEVLIAGGVTMAIVFALTLFAFQTKIDFTLLSGSLLSLFLVFTIFGFLVMFSPYDTARLIYSAVGVLIMCLYLVYDTQIMIGGKHRYALSPEEYVFAALNLYLDIMYIFIKILRILR